MQSLRWRLQRKHKHILCGNLRAGDNQKSPVPVQQAENKIIPFVVVAGTKKVFHEAWRGGSKTPPTSKGRREEEVPTIGCSSEVPPSGSGGGAQTYMHRYVNEHISLGIKFPRTKVGQRQHTRLKARRNTVGMVGQPGSQRASNKVLLKSSSRPLPPTAGRVQALDINTLLCTMCYTHRATESNILTSSQWLPLVFCSQ